MRGPSPLIHQWIEFCHQSARDLPFLQDVVPGAIASAIEGRSVLPLQSPQGKQPTLDTNLLPGGVPPLEILSNCEFLEPLSDAAIADYKSLITTIQRPNHGIIQKFQGSLLRMKLRLLQLQRRQ